jgi:hypothetical protein
MSGPSFKDVEVIDTQRNPPQIELNVIFDDDRRIGTMLRIGASTDEIANALHTLSQVVKRGPTQ